MLGHGRGTFVQLALYLCERLKAPRASCLKSSASGYKKESTIFVFNHNTSTYLVKKNPSKTNVNTKNKTCPII